MNQRRHKTLRSWHRALGLGLFCLALDGSPAQAQEVRTLIQFTNVWKYDQSGQELGAAWRTNDYDDSAWPSGRGLLGLEPDTPQNYTFHAPISTPLTISSTITTYYFRTTFQFAGGAAGLSLVATNLADDGCVIYLNGLRVGGVRAPATYDATTFFAGGTEGALEHLAFTNLSTLRSGENLLAAEVHQSFSPSSDIMWGMKLIAIRQLPLVITNQPQSQIATVGDIVLLSVGVSGGPGYYRWQRDAVLLPSTSNSLTIANAQLANSGGYRVIITNDVSAVTSSVATVTVLADLTGPRLIAGIGNNTPPDGGTAFGSNTINVLFNEILNPTSARNTNNYVLKQMGSTNTVPILRILYSAELGALLIIDTTDPDWTYLGNYVLTVNGGKDLRGNVIAPDSQIAVSWPQTTNVIQSSDAWRFHNSSIFDPDVMATEWYACDFVEGPWWVEGHGCFYFGPSQEITFCGMTVATTPTGFQPEPVLLRTHFNWPTNSSLANVVLRPRFSVDDGAVFYLNGVEIARYNMPAGPIDSTTSATTIIGTTPNCITSASWPVSLVPGTNCFAVGVFQAANASDADIFFCFELDVHYLLTPDLPREPEPTLGITAIETDRVRLSWTGHGYALEISSNLSFGAASYPLGPWQQVPNMSNPYTNGLEEPQRFFRLKK